jgi:hypothetical protein
LQVEVDRRCYLDASLQSPGKGFDQVASLFEELVTGLGSLMLGDRIATAAE